MAEGSREFLPVEVLEARPDGTAKFKLWHHTWLEARHGEPYVDFGVTLYWLKTTKSASKVTSTPTRLWASARSTWLKLQRRRRVLRATTGSRRRLD